jgi:hypothetical protein
MIFIQIRIKTRSLTKAREAREATFAFDYASKGKRRGNLCFLLQPAAGSAGRAIQPSQQYKACQQQQKAKGEAKDAKAKGKQLMPSFACDCPCAFDLAPLLVTTAPLLVTTQRKGKRRKGKRRKGKRQVTYAFLCF